MVGICCGYVVCLGFCSILMGDGRGDPFIVMGKTDQVAEDFLQDGGREGRQRERGRERERESVRVREN